MTGLLLWLDACSLTLNAVLADVVYLTSGETLKGLVVEEHRDRVVLSTDQGEVTVLRETIDEVFYDEPERNYLYLGNQALANGDFSLAAGFFQKALQLHPALTEAQDALGRVKDLQAKQGFLAKVSDPLAILKKQWGLALVEEAPLPKVEKVAAGSLAEKVGIREGDRLVSVWGESLAFLSPEEAAKALLGPAGSSAKLTLERKTFLPPVGPRDRRWPGARLGMEHFGLTILRLDPEGPAASLGLKLQDRVVMIDGTSTRYLSLGKLKKKWKQMRQKGIHLVIQRDLLVLRH